MSGTIFNLIFLVAAIIGVIISSNNDDDAKGRRRDSLGLKILIGAGMLSLVYDIGVDFFSMNTSDAILKSVFLLVMIIGSLLMSSNLKDDTKGTRREILGMIIIIVTIAILFIYNFIMDII